MEIMQPWAQSVVVGRARYESQMTRRHNEFPRSINEVKVFFRCRRWMTSLHRLGGIPTGVVAVETRSVELSIPADPANLDSEAKVKAHLSFNCHLSILKNTHTLMLTFFICVFLDHPAGRTGVVPRFSLQDSPGHKGPEQRGPPPHSVCKLERLLWRNERYSYFIPFVFYRGIHGVIS